MPKMYNTAPLASFCIFTGHKFFTGYFNCGKVHTIVERKFKLSCLSLQQLRSLCGKSLGGNLITCSLVSNTARSLIVLFLKEEIISGREESR